jgi:hypothetical protein
MVLCRDALPTLCSSALRCFQRFHPLLGILPGLQTHACNSVRVMHEGELPVGLADFLPRCTEGHDKKLVRARGTQFYGLGFFAIGFGGGASCGVLMP